MLAFKRFNFKTADEFTSELHRLTPSIPFTDDLSPLAKPVAIGNKTMPNSMSIHAMEGADGEADGSPGELTRRRYKRFATGGAGLLWFEATAVVHEGRANPRQLYLHKDNADAYKKLRDESLGFAAEAGLPQPYTVIQLTHSGRQSNSGPGSVPIIAQVSELLDRKPGRVITDDELQVVRDQFVAAAKLAADAGFDAVDIKACHGYLISELLSARLRPGKYGGSFENRCRFLMEVVDAVKAAVGDKIDLACRFAAWDCIPLPFGWGVSEDYHIPDFSEPIAVAKMLQERGVRILDVSCGNPYFNPHINRPFDSGYYTPPENQFIGAEHILTAGKVIQEAVPDMVCIGTGFGWYRQFGGNIAAAMVRDGWFKVAGFGRQAFAYPDFANDILHHGGLKAEKCCIACGNCTVIMRDGGRSGCMVRDREVYLPIFKEGRAGKPPLDMSRVAEHI